MTNNFVNNHWLHYYRTKRNNSNRTTCKYNSRAHNTTKDRRYQCRNISFFTSHHKNFMIHIIILCIHCSFYIQYLIYKVIRFLVIILQIAIKINISECRIIKVGTPLHIKTTSRFWGAWMQDPYPATTLLRGHYWVTQHFTGQILGEYNSLNDFKQDKVANTYTLDYFYLERGMWCTKVHFITIMKVIMK